MKPIEVLIAALNVAANHGRPDLRGHYLALRAMLDDEQGLRVLREHMAEKRIKLLARQSRESSSDNQTSDGKAGE